MTEQLKPCPFCAGEAYLCFPFTAVGGKGIFPRCHVECKSCRAKGLSSLNSSEPIVAWNARASTLPAGTLACSMTNNDEHEALETSPPDSQFDTALKIDVEIHRLLELKIRLFPEYAKSLLEGYATKVEVFDHMIKVAQAAGFESLTEAIAVAKKARATPIRDRRAQADK